MAGFNKVTQAAKVISIKPACKQNKINYLAVLNLEQIKGNQNNRATILCCKGWR
jgi:hypothetical protein